MFIRNGQALGSILKKDAPGAERPAPKKRGRPPKEAPPAKPVDERTDTERYADKQAARARAEIAKQKKEKADGVVTEQP